MASAANDLAFLVATATRGIDDLRRALHRVRLGENERGSRFVAAAESLLAALEDGIAEREQEFKEAVEADDATGQDSLVRSLRQITDAIRNVHSTTPWIEAAHASKLSLGLIYFLDEMATALLKTDADVIAVPSPQYMYSTTREKPFSPELSALQRDYPDGLPVIVHYPVQEVDSLLLHLIIAHEFGHTAVRECELVGAVGKRDDGTISERLGEVIAQVVDIEKLPQPEATAMSLAWFGNWLVEAICDAVALAYLGPSFAFSVTTFLTPFAGPRPSETHPPSNVRMSLLLHYIEQWEWLPLIEERCPATLAWFHETADEAIDSAGKSYYQALADLVIGLAPLIESVVSEHVGAQLFSPEIFAGPQKEIAEFLSAGILPAQHRSREAIDRRSILLEGWLHTFEAKGATPDQLPVIVADREFQAFLAKALEMSAVLERWPETAA